MDASTHILDYTNFFLLTDQFINSAIRIKPKNSWVNDFNIIKVSRAEYTPQEPIIFQQFMGNRLTDFLWSGDAFNVCISDKVLKLLSSRRFSGWSTISTEVYEKKGNLIPGYTCLAIKSDVGSIEYKRGQVIHKTPVSPGDKPYDVYKGFFFKESNWDGSDIFRADNFKIITKPVRDVLINGSVTNIKLIPLSEIELKVNIFEN
jgi:hypothetical protein